MEVLSGWAQKARMMGYQAVKKSENILSRLDIQYTSVTDRQTDIQTDRQTHDDG